jgi:lysyl-tRNA synthetase class 2
MLAALRAWFAQQDFVEVDTPILQVAPGAEVHLKGFATALEAPDGARRTLWLHTSPEFAMKKLLAGGVPRLFQLAHVFRNGERSALHHPEFTMLEWYRAGEGYETLMDDCQALLHVAMQAAGTQALAWQGHRCDPALPAERLSVADAFTRYAGIDLLATVRADGSTDTAALVRAATGAGIRTHDGDGWDDVFFRVVFQCIEPSSRSAASNWPMPSAN